jgi:hypothetical protein
VIAVGDRGQPSAPVRGRIADLHEGGLACRTHVTLLPSYSKAAEV